MNAGMHDLENTRLQFANYGDIIWQLERHFVQHTPHNPLNDVHTKRYEQSKSQEVLSLSKCSPGTMSFRSGDSKIRPTLFIYLRYVVVRRRHP